MIELNHIRVENTEVLAPPVYRRQAHEFTLNQVFIPNLLNGPVHGNVVLIIGHSVLVVREDEVDLACAFVCLFNRLAVFGDDACYVIRIPVLTLIILEFVIFDQDWGIFHTKKLAALFETFFTNSLVTSSIWTRGHTKYGDLVTIISADVCKKRSEVSMSISKIRRALELHLPCFVTRSARDHENIFSVELWLHYASDNDTCGGSPKNRERQAEDDQYHHDCDGVRPGYCPFDPRVQSFS